MAVVTTPFGVNFTGIPSSHTHVAPDVVGPIPNTHWGGSPDGSNGYYDSARGYGWEDVDDTGYPRSGWRGGNLARVSGYAYSGGTRTFRIDVQPGIYRFGAGLGGEASYSVIDDTVERLVIPVSTVDEHQFADAAGAVFNEAGWGTNNATGYGASASTVDVACASGILRFRCTGTMRLNHLRLVQVSAFNPPTVTANPADIEVTQPATATFTVTLGGGPTTGLRWQTRPNSGGVTSDVAGAVAASYTTGATSVGISGTQYRLAADWAGGTVYSNWATLTVNAGPAGQVTDIVETVTGATTVELSFTPGVPAATSYGLELETPSGAGNWTTPSSTRLGTTYSVTGLSGSTGYRARIQASNAAGPSAFTLSDNFYTDNLGTGNSTVPTGGSGGGGEVVPGTFTSLTLRNNTNSVLKDLTGVTVNFYNPTTGALVLHKTGVVVNSVGVISFTDAALTQGQSYSYEIILPSGVRRLPTASGT